MGANTTITDCTNTTFNTTLGEHTIRLYANDTFGNENVNTTTLWAYNYTLNYPASTTSGATTRFNMTIYNWTNAVVTLAYLTYNNTQYAASITSNGSAYLITREVIAPTTTTTINVSFTWNVTNADGRNILTDSANQSIIGFDIDNCSTNGYLLYNFSLVDEVTRTLLDTALNTTGKIDLTIYSYNRAAMVANLSHLYSNLNAFEVCINNSLTDGETYVIDTQVEYSANGYSVEFYNILNETLTSSKLYNNITLYDLNSSVAQKFVLLARDAQFLPINNALILVKRKYIDEGLYRTVEIPLTDADGNAVASLQLNDVIYTFQIIKDGKIISTFNDVRPVCQTPAISTCTIDFNAFASQLVIPDYETKGDLNFTLGYNSTSRVISSIFDIPSGVPSLMELRVIKEDALGTSVCTNSLTSASGTLSCVVPSSFGNSTTLAVLYRNGVEVAKGNVNLEQDPKDVYGNIIVYLIIFIFITIIGIALVFADGSPVVFAIWMFIGVIGLSLFGLVKHTGFIGAGATILFFLIAIILIVVKMSRRS